MAKQPTIERSENYGYYSDLLWCAVPLTGMAWYYYGLRPVLLMLAALVTAYLCDRALAPLHGEGYRAHEPSSECFAALIVRQRFLRHRHCCCHRGRAGQGGLRRRGALSLPPGGGGRRYRRCFLVGACLLLPGPRHSAAHLGRDQ